MLAEERRQKIVDLLQANKRVIAKDLAEMFGISIDSVRRDLTIMEEQGLLQKTYGGAVPLLQVRTLPQPESLRYGEGAPHQNAISRHAASIIHANDTVFIGGAGIQYGMLKYLPKEIPFTVVTNSLKIADRIRSLRNIDCYLIGGKLRPEPSAGTMIDTLAIEMIRKFTLDICFITGGGIAANGISTATPEGAAFTHALSEVSRRKICLAPHEKIGVRMFVTSIPIERIDTLITDLEAPRQVIREIESRDVRVIYADKDEDMECDRDEVP
ncbi:DeoR/GlpR family DNA-binding transcription regulator [Paenibacillus sp. J2TS4]|uniref:DeoR/GlpR family DNA-binding transcription regulator n=1 Tax=Paenibacillus sp. J2TS4 TaxID=2807194 RepID=UPI001BCC0E86|nr:DeoR/GlpR family DNA-binding transcription regulator [Paenibacillus sp. J2TS4]